MTSASILSAIVLLAGAYPASNQPAPTRPPPPAEFTISGPFTHENLQIFLLHGSDRIKGKNWLTLAEAMEARKVIVRETGEVNELTIENVGTDAVFVEAGEIVKGGRQDRLVAVDLILPPASGKMPLSSYCVESGRWAGRGSESASAFSGTSEKIASKSMKIAARKDNDQSKVWQAVESSQQKLSNNLKGDVKSSQSQTSYQLTLENEKVRKAREAYVSALGASVDGPEDVIGYAFAINGVVNSAEMYASSALFRKLWKKQLEASATEAVAEKDDSKKWTPATQEAVRAVLADAESGKATVKPMGAKAKLKTRESDRSILFEATDGDSDSWIKRSYINK